MSTYHLSIKFPTKYDIGEVQRGQLMGSGCYLVMLAMDEQMQTMNIESKQA